MATATRPIHYVLLGKVTFDGCPYSTAHDLSIYLKFEVNKTTAYRLNARSAFYPFTIDILEVKNSPHTCMAFVQIGDTDRNSEFIDLINRSAQTFKNPNTALYAEQAKKEATHHLDRDKKYSWTSAYSNLCTEFEFGNCAQCNKKIEAQEEIEILLIAIEDLAWRIDKASQLNKDPKF